LADTARDLELPQVETEASWDAPTFLTCAEIFIGKSPNKVSLHSLTIIWMLRIKGELPFFSPYETILDLIAKKF
jgi:hypothetical protein